MRNLNEVVYLHLKPEYFLRELSLREWGKMISSYEGDSGAAVEIIAGNVYITTTLARVLEGHSVLDLRFNCGGRTRWHKPCPGVSYGEYGRKSLSEILDRAGMSLCDRREVYEELYNAIGAGDEWSERCELYTGDDRVRYLYGADVFGLILVLDRMFSRDMSTSEIGRDYLRLRRSVLTRSVSCGKGERRDADGGFYVTLDDGRRFLLPLHEEDPLPPNLHEDFDGDMYESFIVSAYLYVKCGVERIDVLLGDKMEE